MKFGGIGRKKRFVFLTILLACLLWCVRLAESSDNSYTSKPQETLKVGIMRRGMGVLLYGAKYFTPKNMKIEVLEYDDFESLAMDLVTYQVDVGVLSLPEAVLTSSQHTPLIIVAVLGKSYGADGIFSVKNLNHLKGTEFGVVSGSASHYFLVEYLNMHSISTDEVKIIPMVNFSQIYKFYGKGELKGGACRSSYLTDVSFDVSTLEYPIIEEVLCISPKLSPSKEKYVYALLKGYYALVDFIKEDPGLSRKLISKYSNSPPQRVEFVLNKYKIYSYSNACSISKQNLAERMAEIYRVWKIEELPNTDKDVDFKTYIRVKYLNDLNIYENKAQNKEEK